MACNWFGSIFDISFQHCEDVRGNGLQFFSLFLVCRFFFAKCVGYAVDDIRIDTFKSIIDVHGLLRSSDLGGILLLHPLHKRTQRRYLFTVKISPLSTCLISNFSKIQLVVYHQCCVLIG